MTYTLDQLYAFTEAAERDDERREKAFELSVATAVRLANLLEGPKWAQYLKGLEN